MKLRKKLEMLMIFELLLLIAIALGIFFLSPDESEKYTLFEFLGAVLASMITTFGLYKMRDLT